MVSSCALGLSRENDVGAASGHKVALEGVMTTASNDTLLCAIEAVQTSSVVVVSCL